MNRPHAFQAFRAIVLCLPLASQAEFLNVPETFQEQTEWCWAGSSSAILSYYQKPMAQCEIANYTRAQATSWHDFGSENCCTNPKGACNYWNYNYGYPGSIQEILRSKGIENRGTARALSLQEVRTELASKRPFVIRWGWKTSGGHFIVGQGLVDSTMYYMNPWPGEGYKIALYSWVLDNADHAWTHTNILSTDPSTGVARDRSGSFAKPRSRMTRNELVVEYGLDASAHVEIRMRALDGRLVRIVSAGFEEAGSHSVRVSVADLPAGAYLLTVRTDMIESSDLLVR